MPPPPPAPPAPPRPSIITNPQWVRKPDGGDLERYYPQRARDQEVDGRATIECTVTANGSLTSCSVVSESPAGAGFGEATVRAASKFKMRRRRWTEPRWKGRACACRSPGAWVRASGQGAQRLINRKPPGDLSGGGFSLGAGMEGSLARGGRRPAMRRPLANAMPP